MSLIPPIKDAIPTKFGWAHPITGELLVSVKGGLPNAVEDYTPNQPFTSRTSEQKADPVEPTAEEGVKETPAPKKTTRRNVRKVTKTLG